MATRRIRGCARSPGSSSTIWGAADPPCRHCSKLVEAGAYVKASGFGRVDHDVPAALRAIAQINPAALIFGTDLPSTRAPRPFEDADIDVVRETAGERALWQNAADLYLR